MKSFQLFSSHISINSSHENLLVDGRQYLAEILGVSKDDDISSEFILLQLAVDVRKIHSNITLLLHLL